MKNATGARNSEIRTFTEIARENFQKLLALESHQLEIKKQFINSGEDNEKIEFELMELEGETDKCVAIVIVFSAITVEAYMHDYAARNLSDTFAKNHLDKLDTISKWVIIPRLVTGKELSKEHRWFELLNNLIQHRNKIVHAKSSSPPIKYEDAVAYYKKLQMKSDQTYEAAREAIELLDILPNEMRIIDPGEVSWISAYLSPDLDNHVTLLEDL